jgi:hypothetical protein
MAPTRHTPLFIEGDARQGCEAVLVVGVARCNTDTEVAVRPNVVALIHAGGDCLPSQEADITSPTYMGTCGGGYVAGLVVHVRRNRGATMKDAGGGGGQRGLLGCRR